MAVDQGLYVLFTVGDFESVIPSNKPWLMPHWFENVSDFSYRVWWKFLRRKLKKSRVSGKVRSELATRSSNLVTLSHPLINC